MGSGPPGNRCPRNGMETRNAPTSVEQAGPRACSSDSPVMSLLRVACFPRPPNAKALASSVGHQIHPSACKVTHVESAPESHVGPGHFVDPDRMHSAPGVEAMTVPIPRALRCAKSAVRCCGPLSWPHSRTSPGLKRDTVRARPSGQPRLRAAAVGGWSSPRRTDCLTGRRPAFQRRRENR